MLCKDKQSLNKLKKGKDKIFIKNWRSISLLNVDYKIALKALAERLKKILPVLINHEQTAYVKDRFICETGRFISDIIEVCDVLNKSESCVINSGKTSSYF